MSPKLCLLTHKFCGRAKIKKPSKAQIEKQLQKMQKMDKFKKLLNKGTHVALSYDEWIKITAKTRRELVELLIKKGLYKTGKVVKHIPAVGLIFIVVDIKNKGLIGGVINNLMDQVPYLGWLKLGTECAFGDCIPDKSRN